VRRRRLPSDEDRWKAYLTDRYRHLREGHEARAAERFDAYLTRATNSSQSLDFRA
jgi:hypothetical protein